MNNSAAFLLDLANLGDPATAGSKAFNLGRTARLGLNTPGGAVISDAVFQQHLDRAGVQPEITSLHEGLHSLSQANILSLAAIIRQRIVATELADGLRAAVREKVATQWAGQRLAVRSSAVGEDTLRASFAGQLDSYLNVDSIVALETAIKMTWSSLFSLRVLLYSRHNSMTSRHMGVIVQAQVAARFSGVLFTRDPTGRHPDSMLLEYGPGLGDRLVSGEITPSRLRIERGDLAVTQEFAAPDTAPVDAAVMSAATELATLGLRLETEYGRTQDIEWCVDDSEQVVIVQTRPATRVASERSSGVQHWSNANIAENFPEPVSPFLFSIARPGYSAYFRNLGLGFGLSRKRIDTMADAFDNIVGLQGGRLYYNLTNIHSLLSMMPAGQRLVEFFNLFVGAAEIPPVRAVELNRWSRIMEGARIAGSVARQYLFIQSRIRRFEQRIDRFAGRTHPAKLSNKSAEELAADVSAFLHIRLEQWNDAALADTAAMVCYGTLKAMLIRWLNATDHSALHNDLLKGLPGLASALPVTHLWALSRTIENDPALKTLFADHTADDILRRIDDPAFAAFATSFAGYLDRWGFRSSAELMLTTPTPVEDPRPLLELLRAYVRSDTASPDSRTGEQMQSRLATTSAVAARISPSTWWRALPFVSAASRFRILLAATQGAIRLRERARMKQALLYTRLRHIALQLGVRLVERGALTTRDDIFMLSTDEVAQLVANPHPIDSELSACMQARRGEMQGFSAMRPPDRLVLGIGETWRAGSQTAAVGATETSPQELRGAGACGGSASGDAAVVFDVAEAARVKAGQILVTRQTDPGWAAVFFLVRGLVIERGGMLSHGAIIAREYGIPAVVGVPDATRLIRDGDRLRVDGDQGLVQFRVH